VTPQVSTGILLAMAVGFAVLAVLRASRQTK
jgi:hypothetical protein